MALSARMLSKGNALLRVACSRAVVASSRRTGAMAVRAFSTDPGAMDEADYGDVVLPGDIIVPAPRDHPKNTRQWNDAPREYTRTPATTAPSDGSRLDMSTHQQDSGEGILRRQSGYMGAYPDSIDKNDAVMPKADAAPPAAMEHARRVRPLTPALGAEIVGLDISAGLTDAECDMLYHAVVEHQVVFIRNQERMSASQHVDLARRAFGELDGPHPLYPHVPSQPEVTVLKNNAENPPETNRWHTDLTSSENPPVFLLAHAKDLPPQGGDTLWLSLSAAYDALPEGMKSDLAPLRSLHDMGDFRNRYMKGRPEGYAKDLVDAHARIGSAIHRVVQKHPISGRQYLYVNPGFMPHVEGLTARRSSRLLAYLQDHLEEPEFQLRWRWSPGDLVIWDTRCTQHYATADYLPHSRRMHRVAVVADRRIGKW